MIYNARNRSDDATESQKKKTCFNAHFQCSQSKNHRTKQDVVIKKLSCVKV